VAAEASAALRALTPGGGSGVDLVPGPLLAVVGRELRAEQQATRLEALAWLRFLLVHAPAQVVGALPALLPALLDALAAPADAVVLAALASLGEIAARPEQFRTVLAALLDRFRGPLRVALLQRGGELAIRRLCAHLGARQVYATLAALLRDEEDAGFAGDMVQALHLLLLSKPELAGLRAELAAAPASADGAALFAELYACWAHSAGAVPARLAGLPASGGAAQQLPHMRARHRPRAAAPPNKPAPPTHTHHQSAAATLALCLLSGAHSHACDLLASLAALPMGRATLLQLDRLVALLEAPALAPLRLALLAPAQHPALHRCLYSLLMLLPQGRAFDLLNRRLSAVPTVALLQLGGGGGGAGAARKDAADEKEWAPFPQLLQLFEAKQRAQLAADDARAVAAQAAAAAASTPAQPLAQVSTGGAS